MSLIFYALGSSENSFTYTGVGTGFSEDVLLWFFKVVLKEVEVSVAIF